MELGYIAFGIAFALIVYINMRAERDEAKSNAKKNQK